MAENSQSPRYRCRDRSHPSGWRDTPAGPPGTGRSAGSGTTRRVLSCGCEAEDRPADLGAPLAGRAGISWSGQVGLVDWAVDGQGMPGHPGAEAAVGDVDVVVRAGVDGDGKLGCGQLGDGDPAGLAW